MKGYWLIIGTEVSDQDAQAEYVRLWKPIAERYGAKVKSQNTSLVLKEARDATRVVVVEFPSLDEAQACYGDPAYAEARAAALKAAKRELVIFKGEIG